MQQLGIIKARDLIIDEWFGRFSPGAREIVEKCMSIAWR